MRTALITTVIDLVTRYLRSPKSSWSNGISGAIGEFMYDEGEDVSFGETTDSLSAQTDRGAISIKLPEQLTCFAYEQLSHSARSWTQTVALALPQTQARMAANKVITDLGADKESVRVQDRDARLFDLGLGSDQARFCVRTKDEALMEKLTSLCGRVLLDEGHAVLALLQRSSPARVIISALGRIEVYTPVPERGAHTEMGPHTHLLPGLLGEKESVIPPGYASALRVYPPHPLHDKYGAEKPFDRLQHDEFQDVLGKVGIEDYLKERVAAGDSTHADNAGNSMWYDIARQVVNMQSSHTGAGQTPTGTAV